MNGVADVLLAVFVWMLRDSLGHWAYVGREPGRRR